jgi:SAM-dependent methyltransferase
MNRMHEANRKRWDVATARYKARGDADGDWRRCHIDPSLGFERGSLALLRQYVGDLQGKSACVLSSGDNYAAFALVGLGADVTSVDISQKQLDVAAERAAQLGLDIRFVRADVVNLPAWMDGTFDFACSTNGVMVWVTDPQKYYLEAYGILRPGGVFLSYDIHPFQRPWNAVPEPLTMVKPYFDSGPKEWLYDPESGETSLASEVLPEERLGRVSAFKCHWTIGELITAMLGAGFEFLHVLEEPGTDPAFWLPKATDEELEGDLLDWRKNPRVGLPAWLTLVARKKG